MPSRSTARRALRASWWTLLLALAGLLVATPADAHPFGDPQRLEVSEESDDDRGVRVRWHVGGTDDLTLLGIELGVLPQDRLMLDGAVTYEDADSDVLADAPELADYLSERITVTQDGDDCEPSVAVAADVAAGGAELTFSCPDPVSTVSVRSRMLTDLHPAYRTLAEGPDGQMAVYDAEHEAHDWSVGAAVSSETVRPVSSSTSTGRSAAVQLGLVGGGLLAVILTGAFWHRRRGRKV